MRNNIFIGGSASGHNGDPICFDTVGLRADLDYNGWYQAMVDRFANFNYIFYSSLAAFQADTGMEQNGQLLDLGTFIDAEEPPLGSWLGEEGYFPPYDPDSQDLRLIEGSVAIDAGEFLPNINDGSSGVSPDLGAYEYGAQTPEYGPDADLTSFLEEVAAAEDPLGRIEAAPNPCHGWTMIEYELAGPRKVTLRVYDPAGRVVRTLKDDSPGRVGPHTAVWNGRNDAGRAAKSGVYFFRLDAGDLSRSGRIILAR